MPAPHKRCTCGLLQWAACYAPNQSLRAVVLLSVLLCATSCSELCLCRFKVTLLKANSLPAFATNLNFPLLENDEEWIVQGYTYVSHRLTLGTCMSYS